MMVATRSLGLDEARWSYVGPASLGSAAIRVVAASLLFALSRFGGLVLDSPRAFTRMTLVGVYGWLGLTAGVWLGVAVLGAVTGATNNAAQPPSLQHSGSAVGLAHMPLLILGVVIFAAGGLFEILGPGLVAAAFVLGFWFPAALVAATRSAYQLSLTRAAAVLALPYLLWLAIVGRHLMTQVQHLL